MSDGDWFAPKRFGYGAGPPIAWQGWALILGFCAILADQACYWCPGITSGSSS
jgi:hypothetical protein